MIGVEFWGGPMDGQIEQLGEEFGFPSFQTFYVPGKRKAEALTSEEGETVKPTPTVVLCRYQVITGLPDANGNLRSEFLGWG